MPKDGARKTPSPKDMGKPRDTSPCPDEMTMASYLDGRLEEPEKVRMEAHLARCLKCAGAVAELREILAEVGKGQADSEEARAVAERAKKLIDG